MKRFTVQTQSQIHADRLYRYQTYATTYNKKRVLGQVILSSKNNVKSPSRERISADSAPQVP